MPAPRTPGRRSALATSRLVVLAVLPLALLSGALPGQVASAVPDPAAAPPAAALPARGSEQVASSDRADGTAGADQAGPGQVPTAAPAPAEPGGGAADVAAGPVVLGAPRSGVSVRPQVATAPGTDAAGAVPSQGLDQPAGTPAAAAPVVTPVLPPGSAAVPYAEDAVSCPPVPVTVPGTRSDGTVLAGPLQLAVALGVGASGRRWDWSVSSGASGTVILDATGAASVPVTLRAGSWSVTTSLGFDRTDRDSGSCPQLTSQLRVVAGLGWASGASGDGVVDGSLAAWRGSPISMAGTWADNNDAQVGLWQLRPGGEFATWQGDLDLAVGAIGPGETWSAAARGAYDARWTQSLQEMARLWGDRPGTLYVRFAHEFNGDWYSWRVTAATAPDFVQAWKRYRALQQQFFPQSRLVFSPNSETSGAPGLDWRTAFPGARYVDVMAVDYYNQWPWTNTAADFARLSLAYDSTGAPRGLQRHLEFAASVGLPFAVSEWGNNGTFGDSAVFMEQMYAFFTAHAGTGPGRLRYEVYFNFVSPGNLFALYPVTPNPLAAAAYRRLW